jgi:mRNA deadenylase 3'-5' endonuclease subunit Ccr4
LLEKNKVVLSESDQLEMQFLALTELQDYDKELLEVQEENMELATFDSVNFDSLLGDNSVSYITFKLFKQYNFLDSYFIDVEVLLNFTREAQMAYFKENPYHNVLHVIDSLQGLHFMLTHGNLKRYLKKHDTFAGFVACLILDFEHPGYTNQFVVRTKHPLAIRYSDISVLENHHLAAGF